MKKKDEIKEKLKTLLSISSVRTGLKLNSDTVERAYEAYIFGLCLQAVKNAGGLVILRGIISGDNPVPIIFRGAPGNMSSKAQDFCYAYCELKKKKIEIHMDVQYEGTSGASHEIDVSIFEHDSAEKVRISKRLPKTSKLVMIFECKFYTSSIPSADLGRGFVGLVKDCSANRLNAFVSNNASDNLKKYFSNKNNIEPFNDLDPSNKESEERFVRNIEQSLRKWQYSK